MRFSFCVDLDKPTSHAHTKANSTTNDTSYLTSTFDPIQALLPSLSNQTNQAKRMDAYAYLVRHGWSGTGNPLNPDRAGVRGGLGLTKPLLVARRTGNSGVGKTTTKDPTNQWWLRGFEDALKGIGQADSGQGQGQVGKGNALTSELYRFFVRGGDCSWDTWE